MTKKILGRATRRRFVTGFAFAVLCSVVSAGCCMDDCARDSETAYARDDSSGVDAYMNRLN